MDRKTINVLAAATEQSLRILKGAIRVASKTRICEDWDQVDRNVSEHLDLSCALLQVCIPLRDQISWGENLYNLQTVVSSGQYKGGLILEWIRRSFDSGAYLRWLKFEICRKINESDSEKAAQVRVRTMGSDFLMDNDELLLFLHNMLLKNYYSS